MKDILDYLNRNSEKKHISYWTGEKTSLVWTKICNVSYEFRKRKKLDEAGNPLVAVQWKYDITNPETFYSDHTSWLYLITVNDYVFKIGETGVPLGIMAQSGKRAGQPITGTTTRLGRYQQGDQTDENIRQALLPIANDPNYVISFYVHKCKMANLPETINGHVFDKPFGNQKNIEKSFLTLFSHTVGELPYLNPGVA